MKKQKDKQKFKNIISKYPEIFNITSPVINKTKQLN